MKQAKSTSTKQIFWSIVISTLVTVQVIRADFSFSEPVKVPNINGNSSDWGPQISRDGLELYYNYGVVQGKCSHDIWVAKRPTINAPWSEPVKLESPVNSPGPQCNPSLSADGLELYFSEGDRGVTGCSSFDPEGYGLSDLWVSTRPSKDDPWGTPNNLGPTVNSSRADDCPSLSADGLSLYFTSDRGGLGGYDVFVTTRPSKEDPWGEPVNLGSNVNSHYFEYTAFVSTDELSLFVSRGWSQPKIFVCQRRTRTEPWGPAEFFAPVNSGDYLGGNPQGMGEFCVSFSAEESKLYFSRATSVHSFNFDIWQVEITPILDLNGDGTVDKRDLNTLEENLGNTSNSLYDIAPLPLGDGIANHKDARVLMESVFPVLASEPYPQHKANNVPHNGSLSWASGELAQTHDVYLATDYEDVNTANTTDLSYMGSREESHYTPGKLDFGKTYYWRVDEVNGAPDFSVFKGDIWSFTVEPLGVPIDKINVTASSESKDMEAHKTVDGSGLNGLDQHSTESTDMWLSSVDGPAPWIQFEFDRAYRLHELWVWNSNQLIESFLGLGVKDVVIEYSTDGKEWTTLEGALELAQAPGTADYTANTVIDLGEALAKFVRISVLAGYGVLPQYGLSEVRFYSIPTFAREPQPANGDSTQGVDVELTWRPGREAMLHEVYLGATPDDMALVATSSDNSHAATGLVYDTTYYWQVTEVNETETPSSYAGEIWSFTTPAFAVMDDFETYDDECKRIFFFWEDGLGHNGGEDIEGCNVASSDGNGSGSVVGHNQAPFAEKTIVNIGSAQSMPLSYDNSIGQSEATLRLAGQDWTASGIQTLSLFFYGQPSSRRNRQLYIKINNNKVVYNGDGTDLAQEQWQQWNIDLTSVNGLENVTTLTIGVDGDTAAGMLYIDDIRLYP